MLKEHSEELELHMSEIRKLWAVAYDRNRVAMINERMSVDNALYRGQDDSGRPFTLTAGEAVQQSSREGIVWMRNLVASVLLSDGPARLSAAEG